MGEILSFEVGGGAVAGDLLSEPRRGQDVVVGLLACGYFEYWRMYEGLRERVAGNMATVAERLKSTHTVIYPGLVETLDAADRAGEQFRRDNIDVLVIAEGTYCPDYFVHQALSYLSNDAPIIVFASQEHDRIDFNGGYDDSLANSGPMGLIQLTAGFRKMGAHSNYDVVVGSVADADVYAEIDRIIQVHATIKSLKRMTIGTVGHVFRGMYDFNFDKTAITGKLGPHVMDIQVDHLDSLLSETEIDDPRVASLCASVRDRYHVSGVGDDDVVRAARLSVALDELVARFRLDGLVLLGQHLVEKRANATVYLGLSELLASDRAVAVTEGDVIGCILMKVMKDFAGLTPFFGEWEEIDTSLNAVMLLGHGFIDPRAARPDRPVNVGRAAENWGFKGNSLAFEATYSPGPVTLTHAIHDVEGWRLLVSQGELLDTEPLHINESYLIVRVAKPVKEYLRELMRYGFSHHVIAVNGDVTSQLECFARHRDMQVYWL